MFFRFILRALEYRKQRLLLAFAALAVAATLATVLFGIYGTVERRLSDQFSVYGANIVAQPARGNTVPSAMVDAAAKLGAEAAPFLVTSGRIAGQAVPVAGFVPARTLRMTAYWHVQGPRDIRSGDCLAGELAADQLQLKVGSTVALEGAPCTVGSSRVDLQACKLEYSIVSPK